MGRAGVAVAADLAAAAASLKFAAIGLTLLYALSGALASIRR